MTMRRPLLFTLRAGVSFVLWLGFVATVPMRFDASLAEKNGWPLWGDMRIGFFDHRISVFNQDMPYRGSLISVQGAKWPVCSWFDAPGIYYRHFTWQDGTTYWTCSIHQAWPVLLFAILPTIWMIQLLRRGPFRRPSPPASSPSNADLSP